MCGIAGIVDKTGTPPDVDVLDAIAAALSHRGPDGRQTRVFAHSGLVHTRLAIIDLSDAAAQPIPNEDESVWAVCNGEIYNFQSLREELVSKGHTFRSRTDSEVIVHLYEQEGVHGLARLDGMFAFGLWDNANERLVLARDRTGKKPLYVYEDDDRLIFASEIKAILRVPGIDTTLNDSAIPAYLTYGYVPSPGTFYRRIRKVPPATIDGSPYWSYPVATRADPTPSAAEAKSEVRRLFIEAVARRMVSDVPLGAFLSGGLDSSLVVSVMTSELGVRPRTFSIGFDDDAAYDESEHARFVADHLGTDHTEFRVRAGDPAIVDEIAAIYDEPFGDSSAIPTYLLSREARNHVTVALTGDGGDEVFAGYRRFAAASASAAVPAPLRHAMGAIADVLPSAQTERSLLHQGKRFLGGLRHDALEGYRRWVSVFSPEQVAALTRTPPVPDESYASAFEAAAGADLTNQLLIANARNYLLDDLNVKVDRASMAVGLETRAPFLDTALIEYAFRLPGNYKLQGTTSKWILKEAFADWVPAETIRRKKMGFGVPVGAWFRGPWRSTLDELSAVRSRLDSATIDTLIDEHVNERRDWGAQLYHLLMLDRWLAGSS